MKISYDINAYNAAIYYVWKNNKYLVNHNYSDVKACLNKLLYRGIEDSVTYTSTAGFMIVFSYGDDSTFADIFVEPALDKPINIVERSI
jgi:hypothetical protein